MAGADLSQFMAPPKAKAPGGPDLSRFMGSSQAYLPTSEFDPTMERAGLRPTGDYRPPERENQLRAQGAGTVAPGHTSPHSRGTPDAPGAHDFVPAGGDWNTALTKARTAPGVARAFIEGAQGGQGRHIHVDMAPGPDLSQFMKPSGGADLSHFMQPGGGRDMYEGPVDPAKMRTLAGVPPKKDRGYLSGMSERAGSAMPMAGHQFMEDARTAYAPESPEEKAHDRDHRGELQDTPRLRAADRLGGDAWNVVASPATAAVKALGNLNQQDAEVVSGFGLSMIPLGRAAKGIEAEREASAPMETEASRAAADAHAAARADLRNAKTPEEQAAARARMRTAGSYVDPAKVRAPKPPKGSAAGPRLPGVGVVGDEKDPAERVDSALFRNGNHATDDKIAAVQAVKKLPKNLRDAKVQAKALEEVEHRGLVDPKAKLSAETKQLEAVRKPWAEEQRNGINEIRKRLAAKGMSEAEIEEYAPDSGYVPRRVQGKSAGFDAADPDAQSRNPLRIGSGRSLTKQTGSMRERTQIVLEDATGQRRFEHRNKTNEEWKPGMQVRDPLTGKPMTVKQATVKEIEGAGARDTKGNLLTYHKNPLANTIDEALKVKRVLRNMDVLEELTKNLQGQGLAHHVEWHYPAGEAEEGAASRTWARARSPKPTPQGFEELPHIPQLKGWAFDPKVAEVLKDYYPPKGRFDALDESFAVVNRALNASLFVTPFPHIKNVSTMGFIGRGWDWLPVGGNYGRLMRTGREAAREVLTLGPKYREFLRDGASLRAGDEATRNFHQKLLEMTSEQLAKDPRAAKAMGFANPVEAAKALYSASHKFLWNANDMVMFQRYLELKEKGMSNRQAIKETERWVANYRIPSRVLGKRWTAELFKNSNVLNFGHYGYGKFRAIGEMIKGLTTGTKEERLDAAGKVAMVGVLGLIIQPLLTAIAQHVTGNQNAKVQGGGEMTVINNLTDPEKDWTQKAASIVEPAPLIDAEAESPVLGGNRNIFTGKNTVEPGSTPLGQAAQAGEWLAGKFYPAQLGMELMKPGGAEQALGQLAGVSLPPDSSAAGKAKGKAYDRSRAKSREKKDTIERMIRDRLQ
jgi:hypothetical protein